MKRLSSKFEFAGAFGDTLAGLLEQPAGKRLGVAIFAHCFTCSKESHAAARISRALAEQGIAVLRFDFTGLGNSGGDFANTNFSSNVEDLLAAVEAITATFGTPDFLIGHSLGGAAVLMATSKLPDLKGVITIGAPSEVEHVKYNFSDDLERIEQAGSAEVELAGRQFTIRKQFLDDLKQQDLAAILGSLTLPKLFLHAPDDEVVDIEHGEALFAQAPQPKSFLSLEGANHLLTSRAASGMAASLIGAWALARLPDESHTDVPDTERDTGKVKLHENGEGKYTLTVAYGEHVLRADEPVANGGNDTGPDPFGYLMISLGACTLMTLRQYADFKGLPAGELSIELEHVLTRHPETGERHHRFERVLKIGGALTDEQRRRMVDIANTCPVHRVLTEARPEVVTSLAG